MTTKTKHLTLSHNEDLYCISDRMSINWTEILIFPVPFFIFLYIFGGAVVASIVSIFATILYILFRFSAWYYYTELHIDKSSRELIVIKKLFNEVNKTELISKDFSFDKVEFKEIQSGGKSKYAFIYKTHKENTIFILRDKQEKQSIEEFINLVPDTLI